MSITVAIYIHHGGYIYSSRWLYIFITVAIYVHHDGYICPAIGINKFKRWKR